MNFHRAAQILARFVPSVPPDLAGRVDVAFHTHHTTPTPVVPPAGVGPTPEGDASAPTTPTGPAVLSVDCASPSGPPSVWTKEAQA